MVPTLDRTLLETASQHPVNWRGGSGRFYALEPLALDAFTFRGDELYLVALGHHVLWAGAASDLVEDAVSRARFRLAMDCADRAFRVVSAGALSACTTPRTVPCGTAGLRRQTAWLQFF